MMIENTHRKNSDIDNKTTTRNENQKLMLYVNGNHAICDGRSHCHFVAKATNAISRNALECAWREHQLADWKDLMVKAATTTTAMPGWEE
jgi:hypothetical protein